MKRLLITGVAVVASVTLAACGGSSGGGSSSGSGSDSNAMTVSAKQIGGAGNVLVDSSGRALYASDQETHGKALCTGSCTSFWKPLTVTGAVPRDSSLTGKLALVKRPDGAKQVTYNGKLLYSFTQDKAGKVTGDGFSDAFGGRQFTWHVVHGDNSSRSSGGAMSAGQGSPGY
jgi:predicted lipoprotein with Yx(FWY)xxD motif